jgi:hypothetical protein
MCPPTMTAIARDPSRSVGLCSPCSDEGARFVHLSRLAPFIWRVGELVHHTLAVGFGDRTAHEVPSGALPGEPEGSDIPSDREPLAILPGERNEGAGSSVDEKLHNQRLPPSLLTNKFT